MSYEIIENKDIVILVTLLGATQEQVEDIKQKLIKEMKLKFDVRILLTGERLMMYNRKYKDFTIGEFKRYLRLFRLVEE